MGRNVWHKRYHGDALNGYMGLTLEQRGAYTTLLDLMYDTEWEIGIRDHDRWIAGHLNVSVRRWNALRAELVAAGKIDVIEGRISNFRYRKERENALEISGKRAENGSRGGYKSGETRKKSNKIKGTDEANASDLPLYARATDTDTEYRIEERDIHLSPPELRPEHVVEGWNDLAGKVGLSPIGKLTDSRRRTVSARIREHPTNEWLEAFAAIERSPFLRGEVSDTFAASFNWLLQADNFAKVLEGTYDRNAR